MDTGWTQEERIDAPEDVIPPDDETYFRRSASGVSPATLQRSQKINRLLKRFWLGVKNKRA